MSVIHARAIGLAPNFASDHGEEVIAVDRLVSGSATFSRSTT